MKEKKHLLPPLLSLPHFTVAVAYLIILTKYMGTKNFDPPPRSLLLSPFLFFLFFFLFLFFGFNLKHQDHYHHLPPPVSA